MTFIVNLEKEREQTFQLLLHPIPEEGRLIGIGIVEVLLEGVEQTGNGK